VVSGSAPTSTFVFADLAGFTALTEAHGDEQAADVVDEFVARTRDLLEDSGVEVVKAIGDALMLRAQVAADAIRFAVDLSEEIERRAGFPGLRIGMHTGDAVERSGDWFGAAVNIAARIAGLAASGEVLVTEDTAKAAGELEDIELRRVGKRTLRHVSAPVTVLTATRAGERSSESLPIDPVCRMTVEPRHAAGTLTHEGRTHYFCSLACAETFARDPKPYT
jgi:adenylate cyclase